MEPEIEEKFGHRLRTRVSGILIEEESILLVQHQSLGKGDYFLAPPGGGMQFGENAHQCLKREFKEECNLEIEVQRFLFVHEFLDPPLHAVELFFQVRHLSGKLKTGYDPEISRENQIIQEVRFWKENELQKENPSNLHQLFRNIAKLSFILKKNGYFRH